MSRRAALGAAAGLALLALSVAAVETRPSGPPASAADPWDRLPEVLARIRPPAFPDRDFRVTDFGAVGDGHTDATAPIHRAIEACRVAGGGRVLVPPGDFATGPIRLRSHVNLHLLAGATLRFSKDPARYLPPVPTRWEGVELMNYSPLVWALDEESVAVTGEGTLDGQAGPDSWWPWKKASGPGSQKPARDRLFREAEEGLAVEKRTYGDGGYLRPSFVEPQRCRGVLIEGVTIRNAPMWVIHPVLSTNVTVRGVTVSSLGPNNDGCDPESCSDVLIEDSVFDTGDDCIALKSGRNADGRRVNVPVERVVVRGCRMVAGHGGVTIGSEISGGARDVFVERCTMSSPDLERGLRIKTNAMRGGTIENVFVRDVAIGRVGSAVDIDMLYEEGPSGAFPPVIRNVRVERMTAERAVHALFIRTLANSPLRGLVVRQSTFRQLEKGNRIEGVVDCSLEDVTFEPAPAGKKQEAP
jgi:polygalacturonase